jgi:hypothetical protein
MKDGGCPLDNNFSNGNNRLEALKLAFEIAFKVEAFNRRQTPEERYCSLEEVFDLSNILYEYIVKPNLIGFPMTDTKIYVGATNLTKGKVTVEFEGLPDTARFFLSHRVIAGTPGFLSIPVWDDKSFTITSSSDEDESIIDWLVVNPPEETK